MLELNTGIQRMPEQPFVLPHVKIECFARLALLNTSMSFRCVASCLYFHVLLIRMCLPGLIYQQRNSQVDTSLSGSGESRVPPCSG